MRIANLSVTMIKTPWLLKDHPEYLHLMFTHDKLKHYCITGTINWGKSTFFKSIRDNAHVVRRDKGWY